jgi:serine/threonine-protein kinase PknG
VARCDRLGCGRGDIDDQGFCTACGRRPLRAAAARTGRAAPAPEADRAAPARPEPWWGLGLVEAPAIPPPAAEPEESIADVPEEKRFCPNCGEQVGRAHGDAPGRVRGFCRNCGHRFDFTGSPAGRVVADRYEIKRRLGAGGSGTALLAYDRKLGTDVVLKDMTQAAARIAEQERDVLVGLRHDSIVRINGYEPEGPYLVLEYVHGTPLSSRADDRLEVILAHGLQILQALDYLHDRGLLHMDVKPQNIMRFGERIAGGERDRVRLIDFGSVRKLGTRGPVLSGYTDLYAPLADDPERGQPTAGFDLFCLGTTLQTLCQRRLNPGDPVSRALERLLARATDTETPGRRFVSAPQFAEQLSGVIRQIVATSPAGRQITRPSTLFGSMTATLHGGLGAPRPLEHWSGARVTKGGRLVMAPPFAAPAPALAVAALPVPPQDDPDDRAMTGSCKDQLRACVTALRRGDLDDAERALGETHLPGWFWVRAWYAALIALARRDVSGAVGHFSTVRDALPGELIPALALGACAEIRERPEEARQHYEAVADTAPALGAAGFGLARTHLLAGRRAEAVAAAERLAAELQARELRFEHEARIAVVRALAAVTESSTPAEADLARARRLADEIQVDDRQRIMLRAEIQFGKSSITGDWLAMSEEIPKLAKFARSRLDFFAMMDIANQLRPPVEWWWRRGFRRTRDRPSVSA